MQEAIAQLVEEDVGRQMKEEKREKHLANKIAMFKA